MSFTVDSFLEAAKEGRLEDVKAAVEEGLDVDSKDKVGV